MPVPVVAPSVPAPNAPDIDLIRLADSYGVATEFWDWQGRHQQVSGMTLRAVLAAMGADVSGAESIADGLRQASERTWKRMLPTCQVLRQGQVRDVLVHVPDGERVAVWVVLENGTFFADLEQRDNHEVARQIGVDLIGEATFRIPDRLPLGYHRLHAWSAGREATTALVITPRWLGLPERVTARQSWGVAAQLYSIRGEKSWGIGDLADLADLATWTGAQGAAYVLVNPLHAAEPVAPLEPSPYLPTSRRFVNPIYLRPERIAEYVDLAEELRAQAGRLRAEAAASQGEFLDRNTSWAAKRQLLEAVYGVPRGAGREMALRAYWDREGQGLVDFATWCALAEENGADWRTWPVDLRDPAGARVVAYREAHADVVEFHMWLQWCLDEQLATAQLTARRSGMSLGVLHDLAVGVNPAGADCWSLQSVYAGGVSVGAPPDAYNQNGQDWTQPPWRPDRLAELDYAPFRSMVSTLLRSAGGLRVDHIIGLFRLWWIPAGMHATAGTYIRYDHEALIGILALEAHRAGALVVGEDLGTVEPWVRTYLAERGIFGTSILWFEYDLEGGRDETGMPGALAAEKWREYCLASVTTHDLPPSAGYLAGDHVRLRDSLGLLTRSLDEEQAAAESERSGWLDELRHRGLLGPATAAVAGAALHPDAPDAPDRDVEATILALHRYLELTPARLVSVALPDLTGDRRTQNQPGTSNEYPNWRVPLAGPDGSPVLMEDVFTDPRANRLINSLRGR